ncbi:unnamed protein product [Thelazia callipaeda]|uniref:Zf-IS66 domain-containing protein n=1 Tax=Thelazia callipaeda TaxID=103827 RepID=A0A0N5DBW9_THECL|nr:unnamed protein product [Thelazia callipaeda]
MFGAEKHMCQHCGERLKTEIIANKSVEIRVDMGVRTAIRIKANQSDIMIHDKKRREVILIEVCITGQDRLNAVEIEKKGKYDLLGNKLGPRRGIHPVDSSQEEARKHLLRQSIWIPRGRSENDEYNKSERETSTVRVLECDIVPKPMKIEN